MTLEQDLERSEWKHRGRFLFGFMGVIVLAIIVGLIAWLGFWILILPMIAGSVYWFGKYIIKAIDYFVGCYDRYERRKKEQKNGNTK